MKAKQKQRNQMRSCCVIYDSYFKRGNSAVEFISIDFFFFFVLNRNAQLSSF